MISTASKTTASLSDAKNSKSGFRCQAGCSDEFEFAMRRRYLPRGEAVLQWQSFPHVVDLDARQVISYHRRCTVNRLPRSKSMARKSFIIELGMAVHFCS